MFVTLEPCAMCCGAMWLSRIEHCVFGARDHKSGFLGSVHDFTSHSQMNHHYTFEAGVLEEECVALLQDFFREVRARKKAQNETTKQRLVTNDTHPLSLYVDLI